MEKQYAWTYPSGYELHMNIETVPHQKTVYTLIVTPPLLVKSINNDKKTIIYPTTGLCDTNERQFSILYQLFQLVFCEINVLLTLKFADPTWAVSQTHYPMR